MLSTLALWTGGTARSWFCQVRTDGVRIADVAPPCRLFTGHVTLLPTVLSSLTLGCLLTLVCVLAVRLALTLPGLVALLLVVTLLLGLVLVL